MTTDIVQTTGIVQEVFTDDQTIAATTNDADAQRQRMYRRFDIREDRTFVHSTPIIALTFPFLIVRFTQKQIASLGPLLAIAYFVLAGRIARHIYFEGWLRLITGLIAQVFGKEIPKFPASPPTLAGLFTRMKRARVWLDWALGSLLLLDICLATALSHELQLRVIERDYVQNQLAVHMVALAVAAIYFGFEPLLTLLTRWWPAYSSMRRQIIIGGALASIGALTLPIGTGFAQLVQYRRIPSPRYRRHKLAPRPLVKLPHGFYRNPRSGKIYFVDRSGRVSTHASLNARRLVRVSQITEGDFPQLTPLAAKTCFEKQALSALSGNHLLDAVEWLELGVKYEMFRAAQDPNHQVNNRVVKLFAGLCYRYRLHGRIPAIRQLLKQENLIQQFQPAPQRWLGKASQFRLRWRTREHYAGVPLLKLKP